MILEAIRNHIIFKFLDSVNAKKEFEETTDSGILLTSGHGDSASRPRWGEIVALGKDCSDELRNPNCKILIANLQWTIGIDVEGETLWRTDEDHVLAVSD